MDEFDLPAFTQLMTWISAIYGQSFNEIGIDAYWGLLQSFSFSLVREALTQHILHPEKGKFLPKPCDVTCYAHGNEKTQALRAWNKVEAAIKGVGSYTSVVFDDPLIHAVLEDMGGWITLCEIELKNLPFRAKDFQQSYAGYVLRPPARYPKYLIGRTEKENCQHAHFIPAPELVGDTQKALAVWEQGKEKPMQVQSLSQALHINSLTQLHSLSEEIL